MKNIPFALTFALLMGAACTNLDETVYSDLPSDAFFQDENLLSLYSGKAYQTLQEYCTEQSLWTLTLQAADECAVPRNATGSWAEPRYGEIQTHNFVNSNKFIRTGWDFCFNGIAACNDIILTLQTYAAETPARDKTIAEIKMLRAFYYFFAIDGWGNVPFVIDAADHSNPPQKNRAFMFQFILDEINDNIEYLDAMPSAANYGRVTKGVAYTLLAKMYLNANEWIGTPMWAEAEQACQNVINLGAYSIETAYKNNFKVDNQGSQENIFVIPYSTVYTTSDHSSFIIYIMALDARNAEKFNIPASCWNGFVCQPDFFALYDAADTRRSDTWLYGQQTDYAGAPVSGFVIEPVFDAGKYTAGRGENDGAKLWKWTYQDDALLTSDQAGMSNHFALFRYADVLYMYAEALLRQGKSLAALAADADFQRIRTRAGLAPFTDAEITLDALLKERGIELAWEGWRRQDLIRFGKWSNAWWGKPASEAYKKLYPIPLERLSVNPNLEQNDGYY